MSDVLFRIQQIRAEAGRAGQAGEGVRHSATYPNLTLQVEGYTDNIGSDDYNLKLSNERATTVQAFLISQGVQPGNISSQGYGKADPVADNATKFGRAENRRVELVVSGQSIGVQERAPATSYAQPMLLLGRRRCKTTTRPAW